MCGRATIFLLVMFLACAVEAQSGYEFKVQKPEDSIAASTNAGRTTFAITSKSGIGGGTISLTNGIWPKQVSVLLKGFRYLESFALTTARLRVNGSLKLSGKMPFYLADASGKFDPSEHFAGYLDVVVQQRDDGLEIILPPNLLADSNKLVLGWIDAFRQ